MAEGTNANRRSVKRPVVKKSDGKLLHEIYYNPSHPASYGSLKKLQQASKLPLSVVKEWAAFQDTITLHKPAIKKYKRNKIRVSTIDQQWQTDLCDMRKYAEDNDDYQFLVTVIDCFSRFAWAIPIKSKKSGEIIRAFSIIFNSGRKCMKLQSDKGTEFLNKPFQNFLKEHDVHFFIADNPDVKAAISERFNKTLKNKMWKYFEQHNTTRYVDVLPKLLQSYNNCKHSSIKMAPSAVNKLNILDVYKTLYGSESDTVSRFKFKVGDNVRMMKKKKTFEKGYESNFTEEIFVVSERLNRQPPVYKLKDLQGNPVDSIFYANELVKVNISKKKEFKIEKVIKRRNGKVLVKWVGYPESFNEWISEKQVRVT